MSPERLSDISSNINDIRCRLEDIEVLLQSEKEADKLLEKV